MSAGRPALARFFGVAVGVALAACGSKGPNGAPRLGLARMYEQPRFDPYEATRFFPDGRTMRTPPAGAVAREQSAMDLLARAGSAIAPPAFAGAITPERLSRGESRYGIYCAVCHGERADGQSVVAHNMVEAPPPSLLTPAARALTASQLYAVITLGLGRMPSYAADLPDTDRWAVIAYLDSLQRHGPIDTGAALESRSSTP